NMVGMTGINLPSRAVRTQIAAAVHLIARVNRMRDGIRRITHVMEVVGMEGDTITTQELFIFQFQGETTAGTLRGVFKSNGIVRIFLPRAEYYGLDRPLLEVICPMGLGLDPVTSIAVICAIGVALTFGIVALAVSDSASSRRFNRRVDVMRDRAQGVLASEEAAARSLARQRNTSTIDRFARLWLPRRDLLAARLARTGRTITIGQYAMA